MAHFEHSLAKTDPKAFLVGAAEHMAKTTELGGALWNQAIDHGTLDLEKVRVVPDTWVSESNGGGYLQLGAAPMSDERRSALIFKGESMTYADDVARRLLHELGHGAYFLTQNDPDAHGLIVLANTIRKGSNGEEGLSPLGSLAFYQPELKPFEDVAELLTMRAIGEDHLGEYMGFLKNPSYAALRKKLGIVTLHQSAVDAIHKQVNAAMTEALRK